MGEGGGGVHRYVVIENSELELTKGRAGPVGRPGSTRADECQAEGRAAAQKLPRVDSQPVTRRRRALLPPTMWEREFSRTPTFYVTSLAKFMGTVKRHARTCKI